jgi:four helix bundle protein
MGRFLQMAIGSASELEYQLLLARDRRYLNGSEHTQLDLEAVEVKRMPASLIRAVNAKKLTAES